MAHDQKDLTGKQSFVAVREGQVLASGGESHAMARPSRLAKRCCRDALRGQVLVGRRRFRSRRLRLAGRERRLEAFQ